MKRQLFKTRSQYLERQLELEKEATEIIFITRQLTNAICPLDYIPILESKLQLVTNDVSELERIMDLMLARRANIMDRIQAQDLTVRAIFSWEDTLQSLEDQMDEKRLRFALHLSSDVPNQFTCYPVPQTDLLDYKVRGVALAVRRSHLHIIRARQALDVQLFPDQEYSIEQLASDSQIESSQILSTVEELQQISVDYGFQKLLSERFKNT